MPRSVFPTCLSTITRAVLTAGAAAALALAVALSANDAPAAEHEVRMLNKGEGGAFVFEPALLRIAPGDTVHFVATDKGHNSESIDGMTPDGGPTWQGAINKDVSVTFDVEGVHGYRCRPHFPLGMVGVIVVGDPSANVEAVEQVKLVGRAGERMRRLIGQL